MDAFFKKVKVLFQDESLRRRILFLIGALGLFRILAIIPIPGIDPNALSQFFQNNQFLGLLNIFSGGGLSNLSIVMLGVGPFITASIIMQLLTVMIPKVKKMYHEEGQAGKRKFAQYSRLLTVPLGAIQAFGFLMLLQRQGVISGLTPFEFATNVIVITAGSLLLMWIGELITEFGIGNGVSIIIFAGIIAQLPQSINQFFFTFDPAQIPTYLGFLVSAILIIYGIVVVNEAERPIPITYSKQVQGQTSYGNIDTYLPLRVNQAGVMPIIFGLSILLFPQMIFNFLSGVGPASLQQFADTALTYLNNPWINGTLYFVLVFFFTYFYTAITFDPESTADNLQRTGAYIPGVRPGEPTADYIGTVMTRITFVGAIFLGAVAVLPLAMQAVTDTETLAIGGTALLIVVAVVVDLVKRIDAQVAMREY
jgi:preprotein translocase subunit SecY